MVGRRIFIWGVLATGGVLTDRRQSLAGRIEIDEIGDKVQRVPRGALPDFAKGASPDTRRLYQYAADHPDELQYIPCFCGCVSFGHRSNLDCYVKAFNADGTITFTSHAAT